MQCKPVSALPAGDKWTFEVKFDGYRCVAVKRGREVMLFLATRRCLIGASQASSRRSTTFEGDFGRWRIGCVRFPRAAFLQLLQNNLSQEVPNIVFVFDLISRNGELLVNLPLDAVGETAGEHACRAQRPAAFVAVVAGVSEEVLEAVPKLGLEGIVGKRIDSSTNQASDQALGSSFARTWNKSSLSGVRTRSAWIRCVARWRLRNKDLMFARR